MAEKLIKSFTVGTDTGRVDYNSLANKPASPFKAVKVTCNDTNITKIENYKYYNSENHDEEPIEVVSGDVVYARHERFAFPEIDGTGQVNLGIELADGYILNASTTAANFKEFKNPYKTCVENLYRFTKVSGNFDATFTAVNEETLATNDITYHLNVVQPIEGEPIVAKVIMYRNEDSALKDFAGKELVFDDGGDCVEHSYHKDTGYKAKEELDKDGKLCAQANFKVAIEGELPEGYAVKVSGTPKAFNKLTENSDIPGIYKATQVSGDFTINIEIKPLAVYNVTYVKGSYEFGKAEDGEVPATVVEENDLIFKFKHEIDGSQPETEPTAAETLAKLESITVNGETLTLKEEYVTTTPGKKKATITIPASKINGDIVVTTATVNA